MIERYYHELGDSNSIGKYVANDRSIKLICLIFGFILAINIQILWPASVDNHMRQKFLDKNSKIPYEKVRSKFSSTYREIDPQFNLGVKNSKKEHH